MVQVQGLKSAKSIDSGQHHTVIVSKEGEVFACGSSLHGKLGLPAFGLINVQKFT
jgi:alpha-tubulin suppressor-like RCC1 family protein